MKTNNFALRLPDSLYTGLKQAAAADNVAMNQYLTIALAAKLSACATAAAFFAARAAPRQGLRLKPSKRVASVPADTISMSRNGLRTNESRSPVTR